MPQASLAFPHSTIYLLYYNVTPARPQFADAAYSFGRIGEIMMKRVQTSNIIWTLTFVCVGLGIIVTSNSKFSYNGFDVSLMLSTIGTAIVVGSIVSFFFENVSKAVLFEEVFEKVVGSSSVFKSGVEECYENSHDINYRDEIRKSRHITMFFSYSTGVLKKYAKEIGEAIDSNAHVTLIFLSKDSEAIKAMLTLGWQKNSIETNYENIDAFCEKYRNRKNVKVQFVNLIPRYSAVMFDHYLYIIEQTLSSGRAPVPAMKIAVSGFLGGFYANDIRRLVNDNQ